VFVVLGFRQSATCNMSILTVGSFYSCHEHVMLTWHLQIIIVFVCNTLCFSVLYNSLISLSMTHVHSFSFSQNIEYNPGHINGTCGIPV
jgi:hypothetical protein